jgi:hypothetical protein
MAALQARLAGLEAAGSVDHDSAGAAGEMIAACAALGMGGCTGFELRAGFKAEALAGRKINNPDSTGIIYMTVQGIPKPALPMVGAFLEPIRQERLRRTRAMAEGLNVILAGALGKRARGGPAVDPLIDFEAEVLERSQYSRGGEITERHLLAAAAEKLIAAFGRGPGLAAGLAERFGIKAPPKLAAYLAEGRNPHYLYDLLGLLKTGLLPRVFIQPNDRECIPAAEVTAFASALGAIPAYAYLGDVGESPTGDKAAERFEDAFLPELFAELAGRGFRALTYMPPRNTAAQLARVQQYCGEWGFMEISGVDINSSRQSFNCPELLLPQYRRLTENTWALIAHERLASADSRMGLFSADNPLAAESLASRIRVYAAAGRKLELTRPEESACDILNDLCKGDIPHESAGS